LEFYFYLQTSITGPKIQQHFSISIYYYNYNQYSITEFLSPNTQCTMRSLIKQSTFLARRITSSTSVTAPNIFQCKNISTANKKKTNNVLPFAGALFSALGLGSGLNFASCSGEEKSRSELLKEMSSSTDRIKRYLDAENAVKDLENKANENKKKWSNVDSSQIPVALCQLHVGANKATNLVNARKAINDAADRGARIISLPECFNSPYDTSCFPRYAEPIPDSADTIDESVSPSTAMLLDVAKENGIYLIGGSIPERGRDGKVYNTCVVVSPKGEIIAKHRKMHLFDIDIPGGITFKESDTLTAGNSFTCFDSEYGKIGVGICYDLRFPEQSMVMRDMGCKMFIFPGAFNMTTGPAHWELLLRARALDNQVYVAAVSPARDESASYHAWGHSTIISPWGDIVATTDHEPATVHATVDMSKVDEIRTNIPVSKQKRKDLYELSKL
jgi:omega-amidase